MTIGCTQKSGTPNIKVPVAARDLAAKMIGVITTGMDASTVETLLAAMCSRLPSDRALSDPKLSYEEQHGALAAAGSILAQLQSGKSSLQCAPLIEECAPTFAGILAL